MNNVHYTRPCQKCDSVKSQSHSIIIAQDSPTHSSLRFKKMEHMFNFFNKVAENNIAINNAVDKVGMLDTLGVIYSSSSTSRLPIGIMSMDEIDEKNTPGFVKGKLNRILVEKSDEKFSGFVINSYSIVVEENAMEEKCKLYQNCLKKVYIRAITDEELLIEIADYLATGNSEDTLNDRLWELHSRIMKFPLLQQS
jgi:hypothetical protein